MGSFESKKIRYASSDTPDNIYLQIRESAKNYFNQTGLPKHATQFMAYKSAILIAVIAVSYFGLTQLQTIFQAVIVYAFLAFASLILSINLGHDAAHHAVTGNKRVDNLIFQSIFALQGLSGYVWQIRHNYSHHVLPNIKEHDTDLEMTKVLQLEPDLATARWYHQYQHFYAPFVYMFVSFYLIFIQDFKFFTHKQQANLHIKHIPLIEWIKMLSFKALYFGLVFGLPLAFSTLSFWQLAAVWGGVHALFSVFVAFTFFISHHVTELEYLDLGEQKEVIADSWIHHQITTTIDFNPDSPLSNFIFGGFNLHIAHHVFPEISHEHYPALTRIIREVLDENGLDWYKSFSFTEGCRSHLKHLKNVALYLKNSDAAEEGLNSDVTQAAFIRH